MRLLVIAFAAATIAPVPMLPKAPDFCRGCVVARTASGTGRIRSARVLAESAYGRPPWRMGTGISASFHVELTTDAGTFVVKNVSGTDGVREYFSQVGTPETLAIRSDRLVATFVETYAGGNGASRVPVVVMCAPARSGPPTCFVVRNATVLPNGDIEEIDGNARRAFTPVFP